MYKYSEFIIFSNCFELLSFDVLSIFKYPLSSMEKLFMLFFDNKFKKFSLDCSEIQTPVSVGAFFKISSISLSSGFLFSIIPAKTVVYCISGLICIIGLSLYYVLT